MTSVLSKEIVDNLFAALELPNKGEETHSLVKILISVCMPSEDGMMIIEHIAHSEKMTELLAFKLIQCRNDFILVKDEIIKWSKKVIDKNSNKPIVSYKKSKGFSCIGFKKLLDLEPEPAKMILNAFENND